MAPRTSLERLPSIRDSFAVRQVIREWLVSPSVVPSHVRAVAKNDKLSLRQFVLEKNVSPVRLQKQVVTEGFWVWFQQPLFCFSKWTCPILLGFVAAYSEKRTAIESVLRGSFTHWQNKVVKKTYIITVLDGGTVLYALQRADPDSNGSIGRKIKKNCSY